MTTPAKEGKRWSDHKKMEGEDSLRTLECLRGRLLAERQASRVAKEEAQRMGDKLIELENKLREETKLMQRAEKKLKFLKKKLESLKISPTFEGLDLSSSYENCGSSCTSSTSTSGPKDPEESAFSQDMKDNVQDTTAFFQNHSTLDSNSDPKLKDSPLHKSSCQYASSCQDSKADSHSKSCSTLEAAKERNGRCESDTEDYVDNSLALVPVNVAAPTKTSELKIVNKSISEVLDALRHAREKIQSSMERRNMIRVGPS
ncbi:hypothetical protein P3X46_009758 [Hevea brasiliensis]|uniref:Uncharacterized protein n=1 Tax=Hevea brasiliensis TaxID=3981 RepID=A0ABQ9MPR1_HEVBR|nr:uncharacterized protein LOC110633621 [Hevea brasiliensis]KAJ9181650.1 hypothetical protein P3X46_009758 [Hevea brasiliensis]